MNLLHFLLNTPSEEVERVLEGTNSSEIFSQIAAVVFLAAGILMLIKTVKQSLQKAKFDEEEDQKRKAAQAEYWRTMDSAIEQLGEAVASIDEGLNERRERLEALTEEATGVLAKLQMYLAEAEEETAELKRARERSSTSNRLSASEPEGALIEFRSASEALVRKNHRRIYAAFDKGKTIQEISRDTGLQIGEIELILSLRDRMREVGKGGTSTSAS